MSPDTLRKIIQYTMWKLMNKMGKMTLLYLSISLPRIPRILVGGFLFVFTKLCCMFSDCTRWVVLPSCLSSARDSVSSCRVQVSMQQVFNLTQA